LVAALSLTSMDPEARGRAIDATLGAIGDGRCADGALGTMFGVLLGHGRLKLNRVGSALLEIARTGPLARWVCADIGLALLGTIPSPPPGDLHHLLEALRELLTAAGRPIDGSAVAVLGPLVGKTKTGRLATDLLALRGASEVPADVRAEAVAGRIARLVRWSGDRESSRRGTP
jgi:hypothetical protein